jgi:hypothetical protein
LETSLQTLNDHSPAVSQWFNAPEIQKLLLIDDKYFTLRKIKDYPDFRKSDDAFIWLFLNENSTRKTEKLSEGSLNVYMRDINQFRDFLYSPACPLSQVGMVELKSFDAWLKNNQYASATVRRKITMIRSLLAYGFKFQFYPFDLSSYIRPPKVTAVRQEGNWGFIRDWDGDVFHVSGGSIPDSCQPIFHRDQFKIPKKHSVFLEMGVKLDRQGREIITAIHKRQ